MATSILDLMKPEEREKALKRAEKRRGNDKRNNVKVSPEVYLIAEFGYFYGWDAIQAIRKNEIALDEVEVLLEGARKVWWAKLVDTGGVYSVAGSYKSQNPSYESAMKQYVDRAKITE
jgi:hypothetical protein